MTLTSTISGTITTAVALYSHAGSGFADPVTVAAGATIAPAIASSASYALGSTTNWNIVNLGFIDGGTGGANGIDLSGGGTITNEAGATISGINDGIIGSSTAALNVVNDGVIYALHQGVYGASTSVQLQNQGTISATEGVGIIARGNAQTISNLAGGLISGFGYGVIASGTVGATVINAGTIAGRGGNNVAVSFGSVGPDLLVVDPGATFVGAINGGNAIGGAHTSTLELATGSGNGTLSGLNTTFTDFAAVAVDAGATWTLADSPTILAGQTVSVAGALLEAATLTVDGAVAGTGGVQLGTNAAITVGSGGTVDGYTGVAVGGGGGNTIVNSGMIAGGTVGSGGHGGQGIRFFGGGGAITNAATATINGYFGIYNGVPTAPAISVVNQGAITGYLDAIRASGTEFSLQNSGTIESSGSGVFLAATASTVVNLAGGLIVGAANGVSAVGTGGATLIDAGTIDANTANGQGVALGTNAAITVGSGGTVDGYTGVAVGGGGGNTIVNSGMIAGGTVASGGHGGQGIRFFGGGGAITNAATATINGYFGIYNGVPTAPGISVVNQGAITGYLDAIRASGTEFSLQNSGTIESSYRNGSGVFLAATASTVVNLVGGLIYNQFAGVYAGRTGGATVINTGTIAANIAIGEGVVLGTNAAITVGSGGTVDGYTGVIVGAGGGTIVNNGMIAGGTVASSQHFGGTGIYLGEGNTLTNATGATISGYFGISGSSAILTNQGAITGVGYGIFSGGTNFSLQNSGTIRAVRNSGVHLVDTTETIANLAGGLIVGGKYGIDAYATGGATVINAGTIAGGTAAGSYALSFSNAGPNLLVVDPGAVFVGGVNGGNAIGGAHTSTLELAAGTGTGTLAGFGSTIRNFADITLDTGANWLLAGSAGGLGGGGTITGLASGSTIELTGVAATYVGLAGGLLTLSGGTTLDLPGLAHAVVTDNGTNTFITACFAAGTRIAGEFGPVPVEALREGERVRTASGRLAPVRWLGHRRLALASHPRPYDVMPVRIRTGAFGGNKPSRDLVLSPDHAVFIDGHLVPIRYLINGVSIVQETRAAVTYWHVELERHDVILAEGLPCESYLDTGNRAAFENAAGPTELHPDFARRVWAREGCAPILTDPANPTLRRLHLRLLARARAQPPLSGPRNVAMTASRTA